ncbi:hypothetical protein Micbo1qcDRAFT_206154 [Microdochium bolleyi]|uniref:Uncharacterized protein n=1 Tax=Microdochium bolleyi TaxID=196109 RepID=A0A136IYA3_9PEZI|nr:hypothetical protein Micbo1qcDRAFT_206154 [Microdochium bolleyi]
MHFSATTRMLAAAAILASPAIAGFDSKACKGFGACTTTAPCNYFSYTIEPQDAEWDCGSAGTITGQISAGAQIKASRGQADGQVVSRAEFPRCDLVQPSENAVLIKTLFDDITVYGWIEYTCRETTPIKQGCYSTRLNPSEAYTCKILKAGQTCTHISKTLVKEGSCPKQQIGVFWRYVVNSRLPHQGLVESIRAVTTEIA